MPTLRDPGRWNFSIILYTQTLEQWRFQKARRREKFEDDLVFCSDVVFSIQHTNVSDRRTDGRTDRRRAMAYRPRYAQRCKEKLLWLQAQCDNRHFAPWLGYVGSVRRVKGCLQRHNSTQLNWTQLNSTDPVEQRTAKSVVFLFMTSRPTNWVDCCSRGRVEFSWVQLSCVAINGPLGCTAGLCVHVRAPVSSW